MEDLIAFLGARLDEDVLVAIAAPRGPWSWIAPNGYPQRITNPRAVVVAETYCSPRAPVRVADHIVRHDPARVLAEVAAKRQIIEHNARLHQMADPATHPGQEYVLAAGATTTQVAVDAAVGRALTWIRAQ
ncbi:DUF6221 family protein [Streptosporangium sp. NPDC004631]